MATQPTLALALCDSTGSLQSVPHSSRSANPPSCWGRSGRYDASRGHASPPREIRQVTRVIKRASSRAGPAKP